MQHELENDVEYQGLSDEEKDYLEQFNKEWYYGTRKGNKYEFHVDPDERAECERRNNMNKRDALSVAERTGKLDPLVEDETQFMQEASDEWEWQDVYKMLGPDAATHVIFEQAKRDINETTIDLDVILSRFAIKMYKLKTLKRREKDIPKKRKK